MTEPVHILVTCPKVELLPAATLVFQTIRVGFPDQPVYVQANGSLGLNYHPIRRAVLAVGGRWMESPYDGAHDDWIARQLQWATSPFWICDTDVVFWRRFEFESDGSTLAGVRTPSFYEPWSKAQYRERLHTCLMRLDPQQFQDATMAYMDRVNLYPFRPAIELVRQQWQPERRGNSLTHHFYDTLAMAWHAFGGQEFNREQIESFDHLNCATYVDRIAPSLDFDIQAAHKAVYEDPERLRGSWARQFEWFESHKEPAITMKGKVNKSE
jgi:hypothetical protein